MGFGSGPKEDPAEKKRRDDEAARADAERLRTTQENLTVKTETRNRRFGGLSLFSSGTPGTLLAPEVVPHVARQTANLGRRSNVGGGQPVLAK